jgi:mannitol-1-/sugar-/sorbitol-6-phosphatase
VKPLRARALLFDMDGTLVDSIAVVTRMWGVYSQRYGVDLDMLLRTSHGVRMRETIEQHTPDIDVEALSTELAAFELAHTEGIVEIPGARALLSALPAGSFAVVTSAVRELAVARLEQCGIPVPAVTVAAEDVEAGKPDPGCYLLGARRLGAEPVDTVVFEDAEAGIRAGLAAGMRVVVVGDHVSESTAGLPRIADYSEVSVRVEGADLVLEGIFT